MSLEEIVGVYGYTDYMDMTSGYIYHLGDFTVDAQRRSGAKQLKIPVSENGQLIGYANMKNV